MIVVEKIRKKIKETRAVAQVPLQRGKSMTASLCDGGIRVSNLGNQPFLPWAVFEEAVKVIKRNGGRARRGDAMQCRLGDPGLALNSVEGYVAHVVYGIQPGKAVFRRITPIAAILVWAGICKAGRGELIMLESVKQQPEAKGTETALPFGRAARQRCVAPTSVSPAKQLGCMTVEEFRLGLCGFRRIYIDHWENWLDTPNAEKVSVFGKMLRSWQATRPNPMRRPRNEAEHPPPYLNNLIDEAAPHLDAISHLTVAFFADRREVPVDAMQSLWEIFERLPITGKVKCAGITKAVMLLTNGRIGPAFDRVVRTALGIREPQSATDWIREIKAVALDIRAFEEKVGMELLQAAPRPFSHLEPGRLYDMVFGPRE